MKNNVLRYCFHFVETCFVQLFKKIVRFVSQLKWFRCDFSHFSTSSKFWIFRTWSQQIF